MEIIDHAQNGATELLALALAHLQAQPALLARAQAMPAEVALVMILEVEVLFPDGRFVGPRRWLCDVSSFDEIAETTADGPALVRDLRLVVKTGQLPVLLMVTKDFTGEEFRHVPVGLRARRGGNA